MFRNSDLQTGDVFWRVAPNLYPPPPDANMKVDPADQDFRDFLEQQRAVLDAEKAQWEAAAQGRRSSRKIGGRALTASKTGGLQLPNWQDLDEAVHEILRALNALKTGCFASDDPEALALLLPILEIAKKLCKLRMERSERASHARLLDGLTYIYKQYAEDKLEFDDYEAKISALLRHEEIDPSDSLLETLVIEKELIGEVLDEDLKGDARTVKKSGAAETAKYALSLVLGELGSTIGHSQGTLQKLRSWSPADRALAASQELFGINVILPRGQTSATTFEGKGTVEFKLQGVKGSDQTEA